jgi:CHASE2 domain-containing sensor protein
VEPRVSHQKHLDPGAQASPKAIGIDVIFDPETVGPSARKEGEEYLDRCKMPGISPDN